MYGCLLQGVYVGNKGPDVSTSISCVLVLVYMRLSWGVWQWGMQALNFDHCSFLNLDHLNIINSPRRHIVIYDVNNANLSNINIASPGDSPNTDGIAIGSSNHIQLQYASIQCGMFQSAIFSFPSCVFLQNKRKFKNKKSFHATLVQHPLSLCMNSLHANIWALIDLKLESELYVDLINKYSRSWEHPLWF